MGPGRTRMRMQLAIQNLGHQVRRRIDYILIGGSAAGGVDHDLSQFAPAPPDGKADGASP